MAPLDLKPLNKETIEEMGYSDHELWVVRIDEDLFGPFELESLKHYVKENEALFENADACRLDSNDWHSFFQIDEFKNIHVKEEIKGPFWILNNGLKSEQFTYNEIVKKLELGTLTLTDPISVNDGYTWKKVFQIECFSQFGQNPEVLPAKPLEIVSNLPSAPEKYAGSEQLAGLMFLEGKNHSAHTLNLEEFDLKSLNKKEMSPSLKFLLPLTAASIACMAVILSLIVSKPENAQVETVENIKPETITQRYNTSTTRLRAEPRQASRMPANTTSNHEERSNLTRPSMMHQSEYQDRTVEHSDNYQPNDGPANDPQPEPERDPANDIPPENNPVQPNEGQPLEETMNQAAPPEEAPQPVVEEAGDF